MKNSGRRRRPMSMRAERASSRDARNDQKWPSRRSGRARGRPRSSSQARRRRVLAVAPLRRLETRRRDGCETRRAPESSRRLRAGDAAGQREPSDSGHVGRSRRGLAPPARPRCDAQRFLSTAVLPGSSAVAPLADGRRRGRGRRGNDGRRSLASGRRARRSKRPTSHLANTLPDSHCGPLAQRHGRSQTGRARTVARPPRTPAIRAVGVSFGHDQTGLAEHDGSAGGAVLLPNVTGLLGAAEDARTGGRWRAASGCWRTSAGNSISAMRTTPRRTSATAARRHLREVRQLSAGGGRGNPASTQAAFDDSRVDSRSICRTTGRRSAVRRATAPSTATAPSRSAARIPRRASAGTAARSTFPPPTLAAAFAIEFDGVFRDAIVMLNGHFIGRNLSGYAPFRFDVTDF